MLEISSDEAPLIFIQKKLNFGNNKQTIAFAKGLATTVVMIDSTSILR